MTIDPKLSLKVSGDMSDKRLDVIISEIEKNLSRSFVHQLIKNGFVLVNGIKMLKKSYRSKPDDRIVLLKYPEPETSKNIVPKNMQIKFLYDSEDLFAVEKPAGVTVHPGSGNRENTLVNALLYYKENGNISLSSSQGTERSGIIHRLDKGTSGVILLAKNDSIHRKMQLLFKKREVQKEYYALVHGIMIKDYYLINNSIGRDKKNRLKISSNTNKPKEAITHIFVKSRFKKYSLVLVKPHTGRTHQIRVHLKELNYPIVGDDLYKFRDYTKNKEYFASQKLNYRLMLHSYKILFTHPDNYGIINRKSSLPDDFVKSLRILRNING